MASSRSDRPSTVASGRPENSASAAMARSVVTCRAPPRQHPTQLNTERTASYRAAFGMSFHSELTT